MMHTHADKTSENKSQAAAISLPQQQSKAEAAFQFPGTGPEAIAQRKLQEMADNSPQVKQLKALQVMANNSPQAKQAAQLQAMAGTYADQQLPAVHKKENKTGLPDNIKAGIENLSGYAMDEVKVHYNSDKPAQLNAHAYAQGTDIHLASGQEKHLPHEAWHVVQQKQGRVMPTMQMKGDIQVNNDASLEAEADIMGEKASLPGTNAVWEGKQELRTSKSTVIQRKMGVEFESEWKVHKPGKEPIGKDLHKKKVTGSATYRIENDGGELEFVSDPPAEDGKKLITTVKEMAAFAGTMISNNKKAERLVELPPDTILVKHDYLKYIEANQEEEMTPRELSNAIFTNEYINDANFDKLIKAMEASGWTDEDEKTVKDGRWRVGDYDPVLKQPLFVPQLMDEKYQEMHTLKHLLGKEPETDFKDHFIKVNEGEQEMITRPQFSFGVPMEMIPQLFKGFVSGLGKPGEQSEIHYHKTETKKLHAFSKEIGKHLTLSESFPAADADSDIMKGKSGGFLTYLNFYLDKMRKGMAEFNNSFSNTQAKSIHLAQTLLRYAKPAVNASNTREIDGGAVSGILKDLLLTDDVKNEFYRVLGIKADIMEQERMTQTQYEAIKKYYDTAIATIKEDLAYPKYYFILMNRSGFDRMFDALSSEEKIAVNEHVTKKLIPELLAQHKHAALFSNPYFYKTKENNKIVEYGLSYGPTLENWWKSIAGEGRQRLRTTEGTTTDRDLLSPPSEFVDRGTGQADTDQSLGALNLIDGDKVVMELRNWGNFVPAGEWVNHTTDMAKALGELLKLGDGD